MGMQGQTRKHESHSGVRQRMTQLWGRSKRRKNGSGLRGVSGTSGSTEEDGIQTTRPRFEGVVPFAS